LLFCSKVNWDWRTFSTLASRLQIIWANRGKAAQHGVQRTGLAPRDSRRDLQEFVQ
jgi:hypothetical protein